MVKQGRGSISFLIAVILFLVLFAYLVLGVWVHGRGTNAVLPASYANYSGNFSLNVTYLNTTDVQSPLVANTTCYISSGPTNETWTEITGAINGTAYTFQRAPTTLRANLTTFISIRDITDRKGASVNCTLGNQTTLAYMNGTNMTTGINIDDTPPNVTIIYPLAGTNYSQQYHSLLNFNFTAVDSVIGMGLGSTLNITVYNASTGMWNRSYHRNLSLSADATAGSYNMTINLSVFIDGVYNISVMINDTEIGNKNGSQYTGKIYIDNTKPLNNITNVSTIRDGSNHTKTIVLNTTAYDANSDISTATFIIANSTGKNISLLGTREAATSALSTTINTSLYSDGSYTLYAEVNDTAGNANRTLGALFTIDNSPPSITYTCSPSTVSEGETTTCTCSAPDNLLVVNSSTYTVNPSTSLTGTFTIECSATDQVGNSRTESTTYTVTGAGSSTGGGGGAGGVVPSPPEIKKTQSWNKVTPGAATIMKNFDKAYGIKEIQVSVNNEAQNVKITVTKYEGKPAEVTKSKDGKVYKYLQINEENVGDKLANAKIKIQVEKSWAEENSLSKERIALFKFTGDKWQELPTTFIEEFENNYIYETDVSSFSYFAIGEKVEAAEEEAEEVTAEEEAVTAAKSWVSENLWLVVVIIAVIIAIVAYVMYRKKQ